VAWKRIERSSHDQSPVSALSFTETFDAPRFATVIFPDFAYGITHRQAIVPSAAMVRCQLARGWTPGPQPKKSPSGHQTVSSPSKAIRRTVERRAWPMDSAGTPSRRASSRRSAAGPAGSVTDADCPGSIAWSSVAAFPPAGAGGSAIVLAARSMVFSSRPNSGLVNVCTFVPAGYVRYSMLYQRPGGALGGFPSSYVIVQCFAYGTGRYRLMAAPEFSMASGRGTKDRPPRRSKRGASIAGSSAPSR
jgi:hypothetical protein